MKIIKINNKAITEEDPNYKMNILLKTLQINNRVFNFKIFICKKKIEYIFNKLSGSLIFEKREI